MNWKEDYVLRYKEFEIEEKEVMGYVQEVLDNLNQLFKEKYISNFIELSKDDNIYRIKMPDDIVNINISFTNDKSSVSFEKWVDIMYDYNRGTKQVELNASMGAYFVHYDNPQKCSCEYLYINYDLMDSIFEYLLI